MKKSFWLPMMAVVTALALTACLKNDDDVVQCTPNTLAQDREVIDSFITENGINYLTYNASYKAYSGISNMGPEDSSKAAADSIVAIKIVARAFKGSQMISIGTDSLYKNADGTLVQFSDFQSDSPLYQLLTTARKGGSMRLIYPSSFNYFGVWGCQQQNFADGTVLPAYAQIIFDYTITGIKKNN